MKTTPRKILSLFTALITVLAAKGQVATLYSFTQYTTTYSAITGGTAYTASSYDDQDIYDPTATPANPPNTGAGLAIGFNFTFDNIIYDRLAISTNGYVTLGTSSLGSSAVNTNIVDWNRPISSSSSASALQQHKIAPLGNDLMGKTGSEIRIQTLGTAPTRTCVVQWANFQRFNASPTGSDNINFQLRLYETSNVVEAIYGTVSSITEDTVAQVGLKGGSNADFNNRTVTSSTTWSASLAGTSNTSCCRYNSTVYPSSGTVYHWETAQCSGSLATLSATAAMQGVCPSSTFSVGLQNTYTVAGISYTWSSSTSSTGPYTVMPNPGTPTQNSLSITASTWYQVSATCIHGGATMTSSPYNVTVAVPPTINALASSTLLCSGNSLTLNVSGSAITNTWTGGYTSGVGFPATSSTVYTVTGSSAETCTASSTVSVTVIQTPTQAIQSTPYFVCAGSTATISAPGATNYTWTTATQTVYTPSLVITAGSAGITTYSVTKANGNCVDTKTLSLQTYSIPTVFAIATPTRVCALTSATLAVGGAQTYTWTSPGNPPASASFTFTGSSPVVFPPVTTIYTVAASDGTCVNTTTVQLAADPNPTILATVNSSMICAGQSVTLSATGGNSYTWTATSGTFYTSSITDTPTIPTAYNVTGNNSYGCTASANQVVIVNPNPTITAVANKTLVCSGGGSTLTASGANTYTWMNTTPGNTMVVNPTNTMTGPVIYTVGGTYTSTGCQSTKTVQVVVFVPTLAISGNTNTCSGGLINLTASGGTGNSYSWLTPGNPPYGFSTLNTTLSAPAVFTVNAMTTSLTVNCPATRTMAVGIYFNPTITAVAQRTVICYKESVVLTAGGGTAYAWNNGMNTTTISVNPITNTTYTVTGTDANGCVNTATVLVKVSGCVGIAEITAANNNLLIYPNPNNGEFTIEGGSGASLSLINELGQVFRSFTISGTDSRISVSDIPTGIYFITGQKDGMQINQKVIVTK